MNTKAQGEAAAAPPFTFDLPPNFHELPLTAATETRAERLRGLVEDMHGPLPAEESEAAASALATLLEELEDDNVVHASFGTATIDDRPTAASLTVACQPLDYPDARVAVEGIAATLASGSPRREVDTLDLPAGPAVSVTEERSLPLPGEARGHETTAVETAQLQVYVPVPGQPDVLVFTLATPFLADWEVYAHVFGGILNSLTFTNPTAG